MGSFGGRDGFWAGLGGNCSFGVGLAVRIVRAVCRLVTFLFCYVGTPTYTPQRHFASRLPVLRYWRSLVTATLVAMLLSIVYSTEAVALSDASSEGSIDGIATSIQRESTSASTRNLATPLASTRLAQGDGSSEPVYELFTSEGHHLCGLQADGWVTCWGRNEFGQTGAPGGSFQDVVTGLDHTCGLRSDGSIVCWGRNDLGQVNAPRGTFRSVALWTNLSCALHTDRRIMCWGFDGTLAVEQSLSTAAERYSCVERSLETREIVCWSVDSPSGARSYRGPFIAVSTFRTSCWLHSGCTEVIESEDSSGVTATESHLERESRRHWGCSYYHPETVLACADFGSSEEEAAVSSSGEVIYLSPDRVSYACGPPIRGVITCEPLDSPKSQDTPATVLDDSPDESTDRPGQVSGLDYEDGQLTWNPVPDALTYNIIFHYASGAILSPIQAGCCRYRTELNPSFTSVEIFAINDAGSGPSFHMSTDALRARLAPAPEPAELPPELPPGPVPGLFYRDRQITWQPVQRATSYDLNLLVLTDQLRGGVVEVELECCSFAIGDYSSLVTHVSVRAVNSAGEGPWSSRLPLESTPGEVTGVTYLHLRLGWRGISLQRVLWQLASGALSYEVDLRVSSDGAPDRTMVDVACCKLTFFDPAVTHVRVRGVNTSAKGRWSDWVGTKPNRVTGLDYDPIARLASWWPVDGSTHYDIGVRYGSTNIDILRGRACCEYPIDPVQDGITAFRVRAENNAGHGAWSRWEAVDALIVWVSSGDSYSAGTEAQSECRRTLSSYGPTAVRILRRDGWNILENFEACFGAVAGVYGEEEGIWDSSDTTEYSEIIADKRQRVFTERVDVMVMTFGGNDIGYDDILEGCVKLPICLLSEDKLNRRVRGLGAAMKDFYADIVTTRLSARGKLYVIGYPSLFAPTAEWGGIALPFGKTLNLPCNFVIHRDGAMLKRAAKLLNDELKEAVSIANMQVRGTRIYYLDTLTLYRTGKLRGIDYDGEANGKHELCGTPPDDNELRQTHRWMNGVVARGAWTTWDTESFHPNQFGHMATAKALSDLIIATFH